MMKKIFCIFILFISSSNLFAKTEYIKEGIDLYNKNKFEDAKFKFEQGIVFNPKSELSYLYLAKIFNLEENKPEQEKYINSTLLLEPKNEEAMYLLIDIELKRSNFSKVEELKKDFNKICLIMCEKLALINSRLKELE